MLRLEAAGAESLWDELLPEEVKVAARGLGGGWTSCSGTLRCGDRSQRIGARGAGGGALGRFAWAPDDPDADLRAADGPKAPLRVGLPHAGGGGFGLAAPYAASAGLASPSGCPTSRRRAKLCRRLGADVLAEPTRLLIAKARREQRFRPRAARINATVIEADVKYRTDAGLAAHGVRALARAGKKLAAKVGERKTAVRDRSRSMGRRLRAISRTIRRRSGEAKAEVLELTEQTGALLQRTVKEAKRMAAKARAKARGRGAKAKLRAATKLEELARASSASPTSSATSPSSARSRPTPSAARAASSCRRRPRRATPARTRCCPRPPPSCSASGSARAR